MKSYIVLDLEWNQCASGKDGSKPGLPFEIIEIGAIKLNEKFEIIDEFKQMVKPVVYKKIHFVVSEVVHLGIEELRSQGIVFSKACNKFFDWCFKDAEGVMPIFCTWGNMDLMELQRNMAYHGVPNPFPYPLLYYDIQKLYSLLYKEDVKVRLPLDGVVNALGLGDDSKPFHRALDDAYFTAIIMQHIDMEAVMEYLSLDYYTLPSSVEDEIYLVFPNYSKYVSRTFDSKEDAISDKTVTDMLCYRCKRLLRKKIRWFSANQKVYHCLAYCPEHGFVKGKLRVKTAPGNQVFVVKTIKLVDSDKAQALSKKRDEAAKKRNERNRKKRLKGNYA